MRVVHYGGPLLGGPPVPDGGETGTRPKKLKMCLDCSSFPDTLCALAMKDARSLVYGRIHRLRGPWKKTLRGKVQRRDFPTSLGNPARAAGFPLFPPPRPRALDSSWRARIAQGQTSGPSLPPRCRGATKVAMGQPTQRACIADSALPAVEKSRA